MAISFLLAPCRSPLASTNALQLCASKKNIWLGKVQRSLGKKRFVNRTLDRTPAKSRRRIGRLRQFHQRYHVLSAAALNSSRNRNFVHMKGELSGVGPVFAGVADPIGSGFVASLARRGGRRCWPSGVGVRRADMPAAAQRPTDQRTVSTGAPAPRITRTADIETANVQALSQLGFGGGSMRPGGQRQSTVDRSALD